MRSMIKKSMRTLPPQRRTKNRCTSLRVCLSCVASPKRCPQDTMSQSDLEKSISSHDYDILDTSYKSERTNRSFASTGTGANNNNNNNSNCKDKNKVIRNDPGVGTGTVPRSRISGSTNDNNQNDQKDRYGDGYILDRDQNNEAVLARRLMDMTVDSVYEEMGLIERDDQNAENCLCVGFSFLTGPRSGINGRSLEAVKGQRRIGAAE